MPRVNKPAIFDRDKFDYGLAKSLGVQNLFLFDQLSGNMVDFMNPQTLSAGLASGMTAVYDTEGLCIKCNGTSGAQNIALPTAMQSTTGLGIITIARIKAGGVQSANPGDAFSLCSSNSSPNQGDLGVGFDGSNPPNVGVTYLGSNGAGTLAYTQSALNTWVTVAGQGHFDGTNFTGWSWINGVPAKTGQSTTTAQGATTLNEIVIGGQHRSSGFLRWMNGSIAWGAVLIVPETPMPDSWHWQLYANDFPYNLFSIEPGFAASAGSNSYSYTATGGIAFAGAASLLKSAIISPAGGVVLAGSSSELRGVARSAAGGVALAGTATESRGVARLSTGGVVLGGTSSEVRGAVRAPSGGVAFGGAASVSFYNAVQTLVVTAVGGFVLAGTSAVARSIRHAASGGISLAGHATVAFKHVTGLVVNWINIARRRDRR